MKTKILSGLICCLGIFSANAQTITAPTGQSLTITNAVDVTGMGNSVNVPSDGSFKIGGSSVLNTKGINNLFIGQNAGNVNTASDNAFIGYNAGNANTTGTLNLFFGAYAGRVSTTGSYNAFLGSATGYNNVSGSNNLFIGAGAGTANISGSENTFVGASSGVNSIAADNTYIGSTAGYGTTTGTRNVAIGKLAGAYNITGSDNTYIGYGTGGGATGLTNATAIGSGATVSTSSTLVLGNAATTITGQGLASGVSGLRFANITSGTTATSVGGNKVLSVDGSGNVVLVQLTSGTINSVGGPAGPVVEKTWKESDGYLYNNSTNGVVINGTGLDGNSLIVKGGVLSKEVNVKVEGAESWPDYVFKPSYKRMSLDEVEKFININGHLPNVASAAEMANTGNNLNKTDIKLLEKVEELTLYLLEMKKANEAQNAEIQNLKKQVKSLRRK
jgi:trimeric autotransporter adhesin